MTNIAEFSTRWKSRILVSVMLAAAVLSYVALWETAKSSGYHWSLALAWPLLVDGITLLAVLSLVERQAKGLGTVTPWLVLIVFDLASIVLNGSYGWQIGWQAAIIHGLPPVVMPLAMKMATSDLKDFEAAKIAANEAAKAAKASKRIAAKRAANDGEKPQFGPQNLTAANESRQQKIDARRAKIRELLADDPQLSNADLAGLLGCSPDTVRRDLAEIETEPPRVLQLNGRHS